MINEIEITGVTGTPPYSIYVCDLTLTFCYLVTGSTTIPPTFVFNIPDPLIGVDSLIIKIIDSNGCEYFEPVSCPVTPTPTPTLTVTPTQTPTNLCYCLSLTNSTLSNGYFDYTGCDGFIYNSILVSPGVTYYVCGSNPINLINLTSSVGIPCVGDTCLPPTPTPTMTPTGSPVPP
jgi:hypothetical protein